MNINDMQTAKTLAKKLLDQKKTIAIAESCTGGLLANSLTNISGSSQFFWLGVIAYDNKAKIKLLKIPATTIKKYGAVSLPVVKTMARNVRGLLNTDIGVGITGIAGPSGGSKDKPVGLVFIAVATHSKILTQEYHFKGSRLSIKNQSVQKAINLIVEILS